VARKTTKSVGLPDDKFERLKLDISAHLEMLQNKLKTAIKKFFSKFAKQLAECSEQQMDELKELICSFGVGAGVKSMVDKAHLYANGDMPEWIFVNGSISAKTWRGLPDKDRKKFCNPRSFVQIWIGNRVQNINVTKITEPQMGSVISANRVQNEGVGILTPDQQKEPRQGSPKYFKAYCWHVVKKGQKLVVVARLNTAQFKMVVTKTRLKKMLADLG